MSQTIKTKTLFDLLNDLTYAKVEWKDHSEADKKNFQVWMANRYLSMNLDLLKTVSLCQQYTDNLSPEMYYTFYSDILPKKKVYMKYIGASKSENKKHEALVQFVLSHTSYSRTEVEMMLEHIDVKDFLKLYGYTDESIKKEFAI